MRFRRSTLTGSSYFNLNILFIYSIRNAILREKPLKGQEEIQLGIAQLSAVLKKEDHRTGLVVLDKHYSNETIRQAVQSARKYHIKVGMFNLIGLPTESYKDFQDTLRLNQELQPHWHSTSIFFPYKGTRLYELSEELGLIRGSSPGWRSGSVLYSICRGFRRDRYKGNSTVFISMYIERAGRSHW